MPKITAVHHLSLTVSDLLRSTGWYTGLLGFVVDSEVETATFRRKRLRHPEAGIVVTLTHHEQGPPGAFDEAKVGLDHVAFLVPTLADLEAFERLFDEHAVPHSEIKRQGDDVARIFFRDPDNIQLEAMVLGPLR